ncbi:MAG TPA: hypothetical protein VFV93_15165 [Thermomicrobiales bacterium]|nr:hypothetical protein [Thermomicrobiales bacterium]
MHTILSLVALLAGLVVVAGLLGTRTLPQWTGLFLVTAIATSVTGFGFPFEKFEASHWIGVISLVALAVAILARYMFHLDGAWRWIYVVTITVAAYFLVFVTIAQAFKKVPRLHAMAPTLSEAPFTVSQLLVLVVFAGIIAAAVIKFRPPATRA